MRSNAADVSKDLVIFQIVSADAIATAERLLLDCYSSANDVSSLDALRAAMALSAFKQNRSSFIVSNLPPTGDAFYHHCKRAARQTQIWSQACRSDMIIESIRLCDGYDTLQNDTRLKWMSLTYLPSDPRLSVCGKCSSNCHRCICGKNGLICTFVGKCLIERCQNRNIIRVSA